PDSHLDSKHAQPLVVRQLHLDLGFRLVRLDVVLVVARRFRLPRAGRVDPAARHRRLVAQDAEPPVARLLPRFDEPALSLLVPSRSHDPRRLPEAWHRPRRRPRPPRARFAQPVVVREEQHVQLDVVVLVGRLGVLEALAQVHSQARHVAQASLRTRSTITGSPSPHAVQLYHHAPSRRTIRSSGTSRRSPPFTIQPPWTQERTLTLFEQKTRSHCQGGRVHSVSRSSPRGLRRRPRSSCCHYKQCPY
ncbi:uncharacterized protein RHOBADRAFT_54283, partial [Rhodotorula graminis WP1]